MSWVMHQIVFIVRVISDLPFWCVAFLILGINALVIFPIIFNCFLIPKIEKRIGKKLEFSTFSYWLVSNYYYLIGGSIWGKYPEVVRYIVIKYLAFKLKIKSNIINKKSRNALKKANYDIRYASNLEIIMSFIAFLNAIFGLLLMLIVLLSKK